MWPFVKRPASTGNNRIAPSNPQEQVGALAGWSDLGRSKRETTMLRASESSRSPSASAADLELEHMPMLTCMPDNSAIVCEQAEGCSEAWKERCKL